MTMIGVSVPWNTAWSGEEQYDVRPCRYAGGALAVWQKHNPKAGRPLFKFPHFARQRKSIAEMRCTVCGEETHPRLRWHFALGHDCTMPNGAPGIITTEAPVHLTCAGLALELCPHLKRIGAKARLFPDKYLIVAAMVGGPAVKKDFGLDIPPHQPVIGSLKIMHERI